MVDNPKYTTKDVSVVSVLLNPPRIFEACLRTWLDNNPKEIVLVTNFDCYQKVLGALKSYELTNDERAMIKVYHLEEGIYGQRLQHALGFEMATGDIMAVVDDQILWSLDTLEHSKLPAFLITIQLLRLLPISLTETVGRLINTWA